MSEKFEGGENPRNFSEGEVARVQDLIRKVREIVGWDLGAFCSTSEELDMVHKAQEAMKEVEVLFHVPETKFWATFPGKNTIQQAEEYNKKTLPSEAIFFSPTDIEKLRVNLDAIDEVVGWDIGGRDGTEITMLREAKESLEALKGIL